MLHDYHFEACWNTLESPTKNKIEFNSLKQQNYKSFALRQLCFCFYFSLSHFVNDLSHTLIHTWWGSLSHTTLLLIFVVFYAYPPDSPPFIPYSSAAPGSQQQVQLDQFQDQKLEIFAVLDWGIPTPASGRELASNSASCWRRCFPTMLCTMSWPLSSHSLRFFSA